MELLSEQLDWLISSLELLLYSGLLGTGGATIIAVVIYILRRGKK